MVNIRNLASNGSLWVKFKDAICAEFQSTQNFYHWQNVKIQNKIKLLEKEKIVTDEYETTETFSTFFANIVPTFEGDDLASEIFWSVTDIYRSQANKFSLLVCYFVIW